MRLAAIVLLTLAACASAPEAPPAADAASPIVIGESWTMMSAALGEARPFNVFLPPGYSAGEKRYPVVYLLDGGLAQDFQHIAGLAQYGALSGHYEEVIVVGVETKDRRRELTSPSSDPKEIADFPTSGGAGDFRAFIGELKPIVDRLYRTDGREALMGESLAGLFVIDAFLNAPETADMFIAISPSLWWDYGKLGKSAAQRLAASERAPQKLYLAIASEKGVMREAMLSLVKALDAGKPVNVEWLFSDRPDLEHATIYHREALEAFEWAFGTGEP
ncbi:MAG: alpha/beta hydrolase-fold protein [Parvularculaceae bacterium]